MCDDEMTEQQQRDVVPEEPEEDGDSVINNSLKYC